jgi:hypothetical protein
MGILGILMAVTILVINPAQYMKQARDTNRITDMESLHKTLSIYMASTSGSSFGTTGDVYVSLPSTLSDCSDLGLPAGPTYHCVTVANLTKTDGNGWIPVNLSASGFSSPLPKLPIDPTNTVTGGKYYTYVPNYQLTAVLESTKYTTQYPTNLVAQGLTTNTPLVMLGRGTTTTTTVATSVTMSPGTVVDDATVGTVVWIDPNNAKASDNAYASAANVNTALYSHYLKATNFGFSIPTGATINGIVVEIEKKRGGYSVFDEVVSIVKANGTIGTTNKAINANWGTTDTYASYGSSSDLWGETWSSTDINNTNYGMVLEASLRAGIDGLQSTAYVDHIRITVYYTP